MTVARRKLIDGARRARLAETRGARAGFAELERWSGDAQLADYQPYWAARAGLLARAGDVESARHAFDIAIGLESISVFRQTKTTRDSHFPFSVTVVTVRTASPFSLSFDSSGLYQASQPHARPSGPFGNIAGVLR
jgi:hypothetical protein